MPKRWLVKSSCVRGYHEYKDIEAAATREVLVCGRWRAVVGKIFIVKLYSCKIFSYIFCVRKYFCNEKKSELQYTPTPLNPYIHLYTPTFSVSLYKPIYIYVKLTFAVGNNEDCTNYGQDKGSNRETESHKSIAIVELP